MEDHTVRIDYPVEDFVMMSTAILNGNRLDIKGLTKWSFVLEVGHEPRVEMVPCYPKKGKARR